MRDHAVIETPSRAPPKSVASIVTICSNKKRFKPTPKSTPAALKPAAQADLADQWSSLIGDLPRAAPASGMYGGRAFGLARDLAAGSEVKLFVVSAGLGLVADTTAIPAYSLTVAPGVSDSIQTKVTGPFKKTTWFARLLEGPYSAGWADVFAQGPGRVLMALTKPYAEMVAPTLADLPPSARSRLRLFGAGLTPILPEELTANFLPYDDRLDALTPGTRSDFAQRALVHFADNLAAVDGDCAADAARVSNALAATKAPARPARQAVSDEDLLVMIRARLHPRASASRLLRQLRDEDQMACEQGRFARLFRKAQSEGAVHDTP